MSIATVSARAAEAPACDELIARAHALVPYFAEQAARCESDWRVSDESVERFRDTGLHKTLMPAAYGGYEMGFSAMLETSVAIGKVCTSSAWVCGLYIVHNWVGALFPKEAQDELWGRDPGAFISGSYAPIGKATPVDGGYRLSGRFPFCSGSPGAAWNLCGAMLPIGPEGKPVPAFMLVPKADYRIDWQSWRPVGLAGTGSFDLIVDDAFVPAHRILSFSDSTGSTGPGTELNDNPLYRISLLAGVPFALAMPAVGAAAGALERFVDDNKVRQTHGAVVLGGKRIADFQTIQKRVGEAAARDRCRPAGGAACDRRGRTRGAAGWQIVDGHPAAQPACAIVHRQRGQDGDRPDLRRRRRPLPAARPSAAARVARRGGDQPPHQPELRCRDVDVRAVRLRPAAGRPVLNDVSVSGRGGRDP